MTRKIVLTATLLLALAFGILAVPALGAPRLQSQHNGVTKNLNSVAHLSGNLWTSRADMTTTYGPIDTLAQGQVIFRVNKDGTEIRFMLIAANIQNITMAHIHIDDGEKVGPIVVWLYPRMPPLKEIPGRFDGVLARGTITATNLVGVLEGKALSVLIEKMEDGSAYVVVHTVQNPPGEIRGWTH